MVGVQPVVDTLTEHGIESVEVEEEGYVLVEAPYGEDGQRDCHELIDDIGAWLTERGLPWVPEEVDGRIVIRPPAS
jgi:Uma2 family endonuclease